MNGSKRVGQFHSPCIALVGALTMILGPVSAANGPPELVFVNGKVITVDPSFSIAQAFSIKDGKFAQVGSSDAVKRSAGTETRVVDLGGRTVIPGLADGHMHSEGGGPGVDLSQSRSLADVFSAVETSVRKARAGDLIVSNPDWHEAQLKEQRLPSNTELDRVSPKNPVVLVRGGHEYILNSAALRKWNITRDTHAPDGGVIGKNAKGDLTGELVDNARSLVKLPEARVVLDDVVNTGKALNRYGVTSARIPGFYRQGDQFRFYRLFQQARDAGRLTLRVNYLLPGFDSLHLERVLQSLDSSGIKPDEGDEWVRIGGVKTGVDGGFEGANLRAAYAEPFGKGGTFHGIQTAPAAEYTRLVIELNRRGWRVATHAAGDAAVDQVLTAYEAANTDRSIVGKRWTIEHGFLPRAEHFPRIRALGLIVCVQDHLYLAAPVMKRYWGAANAHQVTPVKTYLEEKIPLAGGTDTFVIPANPFWAMYHFITRQTISDGVYGADQKVGREDVLRLYTINNAMLTFEEKLKGSIEPGKLADFVVLSADYLTVPASQIESMRALATYVGGRLVYHDASWELH